MSFLVREPKTPPPVEPLQAPPPPEPSATQIEEPAARRRRGRVSQLESLRIPLNTTGQVQQPRLGI